MSLLICLFIYTVLTFTLLKISALQRRKAIVFAFTGLLAFLAGRYYPELTLPRTGLNLDASFYGFFGALFLVWTLIRFFKPSRRYLFCLILAIILFCMGWAREYKNDFFWGQAYITLRLIWLLWDLRDSRVAKPPGFFDYMAFVFYFPSLFVGPIFSYFDFEKQLSAPTKSFALDMEWFLRLLRGLLKFIVIGPSLHTVCITIIVLWGFKASAMDYLLALPATYVYLYLTVSGATDIVLCLSELLGFYLPRNFDSPFKSKNISEFWTRWNISLGNFFRYIIYFPLQKELLTKYPRWRHFFSPALLLLIMVLMGLWHGFEWTNIAYGALHGLALITHYFYSLYKPNITKKYPKFMTSWFYQVICWTATHTFVALTVVLLITPKIWLTV